MEALCIELHIHTTYLLLCGAIFEVHFLNFSMVVEVRYLKPLYETSNAKCCVVLEITLRHVLVNGSYSLTSWVQIPFTQKLSYFEQKDNIVLLTEGREAINLSSVTWPLCSESVPIFKVLRNALSRISGPQRDSCLKSFWNCQQRKKEILFINTKHLVAGHKLTIHFLWTCIL